MKQIYSYFLCVFFMSAIFSCAHGAGAPWVGQNFKGLNCFDDRQTYGPYNYTNVTHRKKHLPIVENYHFTANVRKLVKGKSGHLVDDLAYTLRAFPNHYKALGAITYYQIFVQNGIKNRRKRPLVPAVECYFLRAFNFDPKDATVHMLYAIYLKKIKRYKLADEQYLEAIKMQPDEMRYRYHYGIFLVKQKKYSLAKKQAELVYADNYPQQRLKQKLNKVGHWK